MKGYRKIIGCLLVVVLLCSMISNSVKAVGLDKESMKRIPADVQEYVISQKKTLLDTALGETKLFGTEDLNENYRLLEPFKIFTFDNIYPIYYYPVYVNGKVELVIYVMRDENGLSSGITTSYVEILNKIDYSNNSNYLFYTIGDMIYAESASSCLGYKIGGNPEITNPDEVLLFKNLGFTEKAKYIEENYPILPRKLFLLNINKNEMVNGFDVLNNNEVSLNMNNCLVTQGDYGLCWAASVATVVRYKNYMYPNLTAKQVADKMGVGYNSGANVYVKKRALARFGVSYGYVTESQISFKKVDDNLRNQYPVLISAFSNKNGHAVTIIGAKKYNGSNMIVFYNSGNNSVSAVKYSSKGTAFEYATERFVWQDTIYAR